ncbi:FAD-binding oxidoreductase [Streptomyces sp. AM 2-1-1]|uniref:FAD-binding oxidoreductase n=1 Tax=Streptomyces sp. AM 2-1-1 TaxID=3028709 RepID=UPI0023B8BE8D|nr:FAD-binding oxidoreductase [Streptomyces sp. AM 2-1-1]WEH41032.1 FAD-binding oxidoreductase [Streptomyces sp. AM 2-1-1]
MNQPRPPRPVVPPARTVPAPETATRRPTAPPSAASPSARRTVLVAGALAALASAAASCSAPGDPDDGRPGAPRPSAASPRPRTTGSPGPAATPTGGAPADWPALGRSLDGSLVRPDDAAYATARRVYNTRFDTQRPAAVAYVRHEDDIRECLAFARRTGTPVAIRSGGHSYTGRSGGDGRLVVDVSALSGVDRDGTIGAGARLGDVYRGLGAHGLTIPGGSCATVGISGLTLGGGHGVASRAYGLTCDSLTSATLVTADGATLTADTVRNQDLFWALRGGGNGGFGVVTRLRFRTSPAPRTVVCDLSWPWSRAGAVLAAWQEWGPDQPDEIWSSLHLSARPGGAEPTVTLSAFSLGTYGDLQNAVDRLADRAGSSASTVSLRRRGYEEAMLLYAGCAGLTAEECHLPGTTPGRTARGALGRETYAAASDFFSRSLPPEGIRALTGRAEAFSRLAGAGGSEGSVILTALGGAVNRVARDATAFVHRDSRMLAQYLASWPPNTAGSVAQGWLKNTHAAMRPHASGEAYQNYADPTLTDWRHAYFGTSADRLGKLRGRYDPGQLFAGPQTP